MPYNPISQDDLYDDLRSRIVDRTEKLTNFEEGSLNHTLAYHGYAGYFELFEHSLLAVQLSGWIETAGGPVSEEDLRRLDLTPENIDLDLLNSMMDDEDLDELALQNGVTRDPGGRANGDVLFLTASDETVIPRGTRVMTGPNQVSGEVLEYETVTEVTPEAGTTGATVRVEAVDVGPAYNVGAGAITSIRSAPPGVREVTNQGPITGGEPEETNAELRERAKAAIVQRSGGGTAEGIRGGIVEMIDGIDADNVYVEEHYNPPDNEPPYVEVTVDGGSDSEVENAIDYLHPTGIRHLLNRPTAHSIDVTAVLSGGPLNLEEDADGIEGEIARYLAELGLGENVNRAALITTIMNSDEDIENIESLYLRSSRDGTFEGDLILDPDEKADPGEISVTKA